MTKSVISLILAMLFCLVTTGCGQPHQSASREKIPFANTVSAAQQRPSSSSGEKKKAMVVYFSRVGNTDFPDGVDATSGASLIVKNDALYGNTQYLASLISRATGGELVLIQTEKKYPADYDATVKQGDKEGKAKSRPKLISSIAGLDECQVIYLGFPNWWYDMPMAMYSFLDQYDLSGKTIVPFCTSGGSGFSSSIAAIRSLEPGAKVIDEGLAVLDSELDHFDENRVNLWLEKIEAEL